MKLAILNYNTDDVEIINNFPDNLQSEEIEEILSCKLCYNLDEIHYLCLKTGSCLLTKNYDAATNNADIEDENVLVQFSDEYDTEEDFLEDLEDKVENWFNSNCDEDGYDSFGRRVADMQAMSCRANDMMVDNCIDYISDDFDGINIDNYREQIEDKLSELAADELSY